MRFRRFISIGARGLGAMELAIVNVDGEDQDTAVVPCSTGTGRTQVMSVYVKVCLQSYTWVGLLQEV
jgi:hypothetical protein